LEFWGHFGIEKPQGARGGIVGDKSAGFAPFLFQIVINQGIIRSDCNEKISSWWHFKA
jgi:hypothetical protein